jgi:hypothetical protein
MQLVDVNDDGGNLADLDKEIAEAAAARRAAASDGTTKVSVGTTGDEPALPAKLRGKSLVELAEMYQNLESEHGRMGNELGNMRQLADRLLEVKRAEDLGRTAPTAKQPAKVEVSAAELLEKPTEALDRYTSSRESALESRVESRLMRIEQSVMANQFGARHPDAERVAKSPEFADWVNQSPVRQRAAQAARSGDFGSADALLSEFKDQGSKVKQPTQEADKGNLEAARKASLETGASKAGGGSERQTQGKQFSRPAIMKLRLTDPEKYYSDEYQNEIMAAYNEGRVK